ncbi:MAG: FAD-dependent oxidoreductase [Rhizobiales bacterium 65-9]|nr:FAD-dependent oxidoreductase [Hyphomicrobiales bacterium]OJY32925.1 MAG: FAD-dependent oxidoreductase [Rhizobiales bacterium 65-9]
MTTRKRDLRTGQPVWLAHPVRLPPFRKLTRDLQCDALVVGTGISGAFIAEELTAAGLDVVIVDRRRAPLLGSTAASTSLLQSEIDLPMVRLSRLIGASDAQRVWRRSRLAVEGLAARTRALAVACDMERRDSLYLAGDTLNSDGLQREERARRLAGLETAYLTRGDLKQRFGLRRNGALLSYDNLAADPRKLAAGYLRAAVARGARLFAPCEISEARSMRAGVVATAADGRVIRCRKLVFATGYEAPKQAPLRGHQIVSTFALATRPQKRRLWPTQCFIWEASDPYLYLRTTADGRVICGGEDETFADAERRDAVAPRKIAVIRRKLARLLPDLDTEPAFAWCGSFGASDDGLPTIGEIPGLRHCWAAMGYGGNGITYSRIAADIIGAAFKGEEDADASLFGFRRQRARAS